jgi:tetratricopeptide (TPR) repeat protein
MERNLSVPETHIQLGISLRHHGKRDDAVACFRKAVELDPKNASARGYLVGTLNALAWALTTDAEPARRDPGRALSLAKEVIELAPDFRKGWNTMGAAQYRAGRYKEAISSFHKFGEPSRTPYEWPGAFFLAMTHRRLGNQAEALRWHEKAVEWMGQAEPRGHNPLMRRLRAESAELLKIDKK